MARRSTDEPAQHGVRTVTEETNEEKLTIVAIDDDAAMLRVLDRMLSSAGYLCVSLTDGREAVAALREHRPFLVICDLFMPEISGLDVLRQIRGEDSEQLVLMMSGAPTLEVAVEAMQIGAFDFLRKPFDKKEICLRVDRAREHDGLRHENERLRLELVKSQRSGRILGQSTVITEVTDTIAAVADTDANVLITGESGTGKELVARELHDRSGRSEQPFVAVDCVSLPDQLIAGELFGHEKGAFTGAEEQRVGLLEMAQGGTLFLDEITELGTDVQAKLLRVLQERQFRRVGGRELMDADVRIISATNRDPQQAVKDNLFRLDLYYRLNVIPVRLPPLRDRRDDIPLLAERFLADFCSQHRRPPKHIETEAMALLRNNPWPGNVRELKNLIQRLVVMVPHDSVTEHDVQGLLDDSDSPSGDPEALLDLPFKEAKEILTQRFEKRYITHLLDQHHGVVLHAAEAAGVNRKTFTRLIAELGIR